MAFGTAEGLSVRQLVVEDHDRVPARPLAGEYFRGIADALIGSAKLGIYLASFVAAIAGMTVLAVLARREAPANSAQSG